LNWLKTKTEMLESCVVAPDQKMLENQSKIIKILGEEQRNESPRWIKFNNDAGEVVRLAADSGTFCDQVVSRVDDLNRRWKLLEESVGKRSAEMSEARKLVSVFESLRNDILGDLKVSCSQHNMY
jgi:hypothetical protein